MKIQLCVLSIAAVSLLGAVNLAPRHAPAQASASAVLPSSAVESDWIGQIKAWRILADGSVCLQMSGARNGRDFTSWFATPASRTATTIFEDLVLESVIGIVTSDKSNMQIYIRADDSNEQSGATIEEARTIMTIGGTL